VPSNEEKIKAIAKKAEVDVEEVQERVEEEFQDLKEHQTSAMPDDELRGHAISVVKNDYLNMTGGGGFGAGDAEEIPILTLGFQRKEADYFVTDDPALLGAGIINPPDSPAGFATFIIDSGDGVDLELAADAFQPLRTVRGAVAVRQFGSWDGEPNFKKGGNPTYICNTTSDSKFEIVADPSELPSDDPLSELPGDREDKRQMIHNNFITEEDSFTLETYAEHETLKNDNGYGIGFGVDVKRIRGEVVDSVRFDGGGGIIKMTDDTIFSEEDIPQELIGDESRTPGLKVSVAGDLVVGENSIIDAYGYIRQRNDGQYELQCLGIIPIVEYEYDGPEVGGDDGSDDAAAEEDTI
jgi:hypothetical protein